MKHRNHISQQGLTLVELMISVALGLALMAGAITLFQQNKQTYNFQESIARLQENGRFALDMITRDIRGSGYWGCASARPQITNVLNHSSDVPFSFELGVEGFDAQSGAWNPTVGADITGIAGVSLLSGRDILAVRTASGCGSRVDKHPGGSLPGSANISIPAGSTCIKQFDIIMVSDCNDAAVFQITSYIPAAGTIVHNTGLGTPGNSTNGLRKRYTGGEIVLMSSHIYFIQNGASGLPSLWRSENGLPAQEMVEGVDDMQLEYGEDTDSNGEVDVFRTADAVADWNDVIAVRVNLLLMTSRDNILDTPQNYTFYGTPTTAADNRVRKTFSTTIAIRNRMS